MTTHTLVLTSIILIARPAGAGLTLIRTRVTTP